jgi:putative DNA primase/helicase
MLDVVNGTTPEQEALRQVLYGEGGIESARRIISGAARDNLPKVVELQTRDALALGRKAGIPDTEIFAHIAGSVIARGDMDDNELQAIFTKVARSPEKPREQRNGVGSASPPAQLKITCLADVETKPVSWLWAGRLARGKLTLLSGDPGVGKTQIACFCASIITTGERWPDGERSPIGTALMLTAEDGLADTLRPRVEAAGGDLRRFHSIEGVLDASGKVRSFNLQEDIARLRAAIERFGDVALIIIDPITSYMGKIDSHRTADVRAVLEPLSHLADETGVCILAISHPPKASQSKAMNAVTGSLAFVAAARIVFVAMAEPDTTTERKVLLAVKNNLGPASKGLGYRMVQTIVSNDVVACYVAWDDQPVTMTADEALNQSASSQSHGGKIADAKDLLREELANGPVAQEKLVAAAEAAGIKERTLRRAKKALKIESKKGDFDSNWMWSLPKAANEDGQTL